MGEEIKMKKDSNSQKSWSWKSWSVVFLVIVTAISVGFWQKNHQSLSIFGFNKNCPCTNLPKLDGIVEDCCCDYKTVDTINEEVLYPSLQELVKTPFFRYFKVKLWCNCPFWPDDGMCRLRDCSVCECPDHEFPQSFKGIAQLSANDLKCQEGKPEAVVDRTLDKKAFKGWMEVDNPWTYDDETDNYLPGDGWRVFYKLVSGLHSSISAHIAMDYLLDEATNTWGPNATLLYDRVLRYPEHVRNLYFAYLFVLRAVTKAGDYLSQAEYSTGNPLEDKLTFSLVNQLVYNRRLQSACPVPFDEAKLLKGENANEIKHQIQLQFRNISALMDCVGCEKCRLWGKLQTLGLGTALKILFEVDGNSSGQLQLQRNEVIALINLLSRLSESIRSLHHLASLDDKALSADKAITSGQILTPMRQS